jgi:2-hydroxycyclohexanecarboxyl-CoA dehydrogenase
VAPGPVDTPLMAAAVESFGRRGAIARQAMIDATLLKRTGDPQEIAAAIAFLASDDASYITGHTLAVSGGVSLQ